MAEAEKRADILGAARMLALRHGLSGITMEAVAREARVAKPTLYKYYRDKHALFEGVVTQLLLDLHRNFTAALAAEVPPAARIGAALTAKYAALTAFMDGSPHADELYSENDRLAAPQVEAAEAESLAAIVEVLIEARVENPALVARVITDGAYGIFRKARTGTDIATPIRLLVERLVG